MPNWQLTVPPPGPDSATTPEPSIRRYTFGKNAEAMATVPPGCGSSRNRSHAPTPNWQLTFPAPGPDGATIPEPSIRRCTFGKDAEPSATGCAPPPALNVIVAPDTDTLVMFSPELPPSHHLALGLVLSEN